MNPMKRLYSSGGQKRAGKSRKIELLPSARSLRYKNQVLIFLQLQLMWRMQRQQHKKKPMLVQVAPMHLKLLNREETSLGEADDINSNFTSSFDCNLIKLGRSFPTDRVHFPFSITSASLKSVILNQGHIVL